MATTAGDLVDRNQPWPGLATFTEAQRAYFFGRDDETRELLRKVERRTLAVLFGQSGLGKSSLLQAGVFPRLRETGVWPIYVRLDHDVDAAPLAEQIKTFVREGTTEAGTWSRPGCSVAGETLWEFFHHRDDVLTSKDGKVLVPLLVFDQFEEIFTLGAASDEARKRADAFIEQFADLIENRPPADFDARIDAGTTNGDDFDHTRADYRILIALREDYLPHLESLKARIPSLMQNRMRLTRLQGENALEAVLKPVPGLVSEEVARSIVGYVAGRADLAQAEVEPALLSLVCRELNARRIAKGEAVISSDLLEGSRETILNEFYERCVAPHPIAVREFIEDELLTDSGYRENIALERAQKALRERSVDPKVIDALVASRLLRIEERLDLRRIELTHDVLCAVVRASRDQRRQRIEAEKAAAEARLQKKRLWWARGIAAGLVFAVALISFFAVRINRLREEGLRRATRVDLEFSASKAAEGKNREAMALLIRAAESDPANPAVATRILTALASTDYPLLEKIDRPEFKHIKLVHCLPDASRLILVNDEDEVLFVDPDSFQVTHRTKVPFEVIGILLPKDAGTHALVWGAENDEKRWRSISLDLSTGDLVALEADRDHFTNFYGDGWYDLSADGSRAVVRLDKVWDNSPVEFHVVDMASGKTVFRYVQSPGDNASSVALSWDASLLAITDWGGQVKCWNIPSGTPWHSPKLISSISGTWLARSHRLLVGSRQNIFVINEDGSIESLPNSDGLPWLRSLSDSNAFESSYGEKTLVRQTLNEEGKLGGRVVFNFPNLIQRVRSYANDRYVLAVTSEHEAGVWDGKTGKPLFEPQLSVRGPESVAIDPKRNRLIASLETGELGVRTLTTARIAGLSRPLPGIKEFSHMLWRAPGPDASFSLLAPGAQNRVDPRNLSLNDRIELPAGFQPGWMDSARNQIIGYRGEDCVVLRWDGTGAYKEKVLRLPGGTPQFTLSVNLKARRCITEHAGVAIVWDLDTLEPAGPAIDGVKRISWGTSQTNSAGDRVLLGGSQLGVWEIKSGRQLWLRTDINWSLKSAIAPDGSTVFCCDGSGFLHVLNGADGKALAPSVSLGRAAIQGDPPFAAYSQDSSRVAWGGADGAVWVFDARSGRPLGEPLKGNSATLALIFLDSRLLLVFDREQCTLWDVEAGMALDRRPSVGNIAAGDISSDSRWVAVINRSGELETWAVPPRELKAPVPSWLLRLARAVNGVEYNAEGRLVKIPESGRMLDEARKEIGALKDADDFAHWAKWIIADPVTRPVSPFATVTRAEAESQGILAK